MVNQRPVIPNQIFRPGTRQSRTRAGYGDRIAVIGAFPSESYDVVYASKYFEAVEQLNITVGLNDKYNEDTYKETKNQLDPTKDFFDGARALRRIFMEGSGENNVSEAVIINTSTKNGCVDTGEKDSENNAIQQQVYNAELEFAENDKPEAGTVKDGVTKLDFALERLKEEDYNILFLAWTPTLEQIKQIIQFCGDEFARSNPIGVIFGYGDKPRAVIDATNSHEVEQSVVETVVKSTQSMSISPEEQDDITVILKEFENATVDDNHHHTLYGLIPQSFKLTFEDEYLSPLESAAHYCGVIAGVPVNQSMTDEVIPFVESVNENLVYDQVSVTRRKLTNDLTQTVTDGYKLVQEGATMFKKQNRNSKAIVCINSTQPGAKNRIYDIAHLRTAAYCIRAMQLREFFGEFENVITLDSIFAKLTTLKTNLLSAFNNILYDIDYTLGPHDNNCIDVYVTIREYDILLQEEIYVDEVVLTWQI